MDVFAASQYVTSLDFEWTRFSCFTRTGFQAFEFLQLQFYLIHVFCPVLNAVTYLIVNYFDRSDIITKLLQ